MRRFRKEFGLKKARILRERLIPVSQRLKIGINRHPHFCIRGKPLPSAQPFVRHFGVKYTLLTK